MNDFCRRILQDIFGKFVRNLVDDYQRFAVFAYLGKHIREHAHRIFFTFVVARHDFTQQTMRLLYQRYVSEIFIGAIGTLNRLIQPTHYQRHD